MTARHHEEMIFTVFVWLFYFRIGKNIFTFVWLNNPTLSSAASLLRILDHIKLDADTQ